MEQLKAPVLGVFHLMSPVIQYVLIALWKPGLGPELR